MQNNKRGLSAYCYVSQLISVIYLLFSRCSFVACIFVLWQKFSKLFVHFEPLFFLGTQLSCDICLADKREIVLLRCDFFKVGRCRSVFL